MGVPKQPKKALLFIAVLFSDPAVYTQTCAMLEDQFGPIIMESPAMCWDYSEYYDKEMGNQLMRRFIFFSRLIDEGMLARIKIATNKIENRMAVAEKRRINLDPGYITHAKVVLASTKDYAHRIYIGEGIYAEITLMYIKKQLQKGPFTYRDYVDKRTLRVLTIARKLFSDVLLFQSAA